VEEQVAKRAAAADASAGTRLNSTAAVVEAAPNPQPKKFDLALITGIGVAIGSIGTFGAAVFAKFVELPSWQVPLILIGLMLVVALPSMFIAALKLRQRTLGPILEGNGWAINGRVKINIPFGAALTKVATLPPNAQRSLEDPYEDKEAKRQRRRIVAALVILLAAAIWVRVNHNHNGRYFWESPKVEKAAAEPAK
jgi:hypothetical protein